jgi:hypothetical protein
MLYLKEVTDMFKHSINTIDLISEIFFAVAVLAAFAAAILVTTPAHTVSAQVPRTTAYTIGATTFGGPVRVEIINLNGTEFAVAYSPNGISICQVH